MPRDSTDGPSSDGLLRTAVDPAADLALERLRPAYEVERELPPGGMSRVFLARDTALDRRVVIKVLPAHLATPGALDRFRREILMVAGLHHPNIVGVITAGDVGGVPYYVMPFIEGASLAERLAAAPRLPVGEATAILRDVARALAYAHARGIVHRDVKPRNVLLVGGAAVVTDFGVAKALRDAVHGGSGEHVSSARVRDSLTGTGLSVGTPLYMAPEQAAGDPDIDSRADLYAFGATAYEMLTSGAPFADLPPHALLRAKLTTAPTPIVIARQDVPPALAALIEECLATNPAERPASADVVVERLGLATSDAANPRATRPPIARRSTRAIVAGVTAGLVALAAGAVALGRWSARPVRPAAAPSADSSPVAADARLSLVVIPVVPLSEDSSDAHLAEGLTAHLAAMLSRMPGVRVVSPSLIQQMMRAGEAPEQVAKRLGAAYAIEGTLERVDRQVRTTARLVDARTGTMKWAGAFDRSTTEVFALQDDVVVGVANGIRPGTVLPNASPPPSQAAYELVLRGDRLLRTRRAADLREAIAAFQRATALAPGYVPAYSALAGAYTLLPLYGGAAGDDALARATAAADRAVALDSNSAPAQAARAHVLDARWAWADAERAYQRALALAPDDAPTWQAFGEHLLLRSRTSESIDALRRAVRIDSTLPVTHAALAVALAIGKRAPEALAQASMAVQGDPTFATGWMLMGATHLIAGHVTEARAALGAGLALDPSSALGTGLAAYAAARAGDADEVARLGTRIGTLARAPGGTLALVHLRLGEHDAAGALDALEKAVARHDPLLLSEPLASPMYDDVRAHPRFTALLARMGLGTAR